MGARKNNQIGKTFGRLTVIAEAPSEKREDGNGSFTRWVCSCDCGAKVIVRTNGLVSNTTRSCGCMGSDTRRKNKKIPNTRAGFLRVYRAYEMGAEKRGFEFSLTQNDFYKLNQDNCHYCGSLPKTLATTGSKSSNYYYNGIDRKDNFKGYILENCLTCCDTCNKAKHTKTYLEFINWIDALYKFRVKQVTQIA